MQADLEWMHKKGSGGKKRQHDAITSDFETVRYGKAARFDNADAHRAHHNSTTTIANTLHDTTKHTLSEVAMMPQLTN